MPRLDALARAAIDRLLGPVLSPEALAASLAIMGIDRQLIADGTYFVVAAGAQFAGCGGWSRRATPYGGDHSPGRDARLLDPATEAARIRAMYTDPAFARRGIGRLILGLCEAAARAEGFRRVTLTATVAGEPLYLACGYIPAGRFTDASGGAPVPLLRMEKDL
jgi:GNAT superfamily N-acetyltransferase